MISASILYISAITLDYNRSYKRLYYQVLEYLRYYYSYTSPRSYLIRFENNSRNNINYSNESSRKYKYILIGYYTELED
ncbi:hypothetical protein BGZ60DRAFT_443007 [Tricladium varicosporioides]|nr:hypothetical protein BGZ60DRAFT_443007 [Hymenoscyphus varicosporioides]